MVGDPPDTRVDARALRRKLRRWARRLGRRAVYEALVLWYAYRDTRTPRWAKLAIAGALAYLVMPLDALPDPIFIDDIAVLTRVLLAVRARVRPEHEERACAQTEEWFGAPAVSDGGPMTDARPQ